MNLSVESTVEKLLPRGGSTFSMDEQDVRRILRFEHTMIGSTACRTDAAPHPRLWGTFPRVLATTLEIIGLFRESVIRNDRLTASTFGPRTGAS